jgi:hypothetical protein
MPIVIEGKFERTRERVVAPKEGGKQFEPFKRVEVIVSDYDGELTRRIEYEPGELPEEVAAAEPGDSLRLRVRFNGVFQGDPQWVGLTSGK